MGVDQSWMCVVCIALGWRNHDACRVSLTLPPIVLSPSSSMYVYECSTRQQAA